MVDYKINNEIYLKLIKLSLIRRWYIDGGTYQFVFPLVGVGHVDGEGVHRAVVGARPQRRR